MKHLYFLLITWMFSALLSPSYSATAKGGTEELLVVQAVSKDRRSFVISKGLRDGISKGQEVIFANANSSIVCRAIEVNRAYSLWRPLDPEVNIPFNREDIISYNTHAYGNVALEVVSDFNRITPKFNYDEAYRRFRTQDSYTLFVSYNNGLSQSSSEISTDQNTSRRGYTIGFDYNYRFLKEFEMSSGARLENEVYRLSSPQLDIPTSRFIAMLAATYHFVNFSEDANNFYLSLAVGIGTSRTTINQENASGLVTILPEARVGYLMPFSKSVAMVFEGAVDSLSAKEKLDTGVTQTTNMLNLKFSLGLRF